MKKLFLYTVLALVVFNSCSKDDTLSSEDHTAADLTAASAHPANVEHIKESEIFAYADAVWNPCTEEYVDISGTVHYQLRWIISNNKLTYVLHFNASNLKGIGRTSGTRYVTTSTFNYNNTDNLGEQVLFQQCASTHYTALGADGSFTVVIDWHLTINANGEEAVFFTTDGGVIACK